VIACGNRADRMPCHLPRSTRPVRLPRSSPA
jgi:hypothetical protein